MSNNFEFLKCDFPGLFEIKPRRFDDNRGFFFEQYKKEEFSAAGITCDFVQDNVSWSKKGVIRGMHFQKRCTQAKLVAVLKGVIADVVIDLRNDSPTFGKYKTFILNDNDLNMVFIPQGFAHGFAVLSEEALVQYKCSDFYNPQSEDGIVFNDSTVGIDWKNLLSTSEYTVSEKDCRLPGFSPDKKYFNLKGEWIGE